MWDKIVESIVKASQFIPENAVVLPINFSANWLSGNYSNYLGSAEKLKEYSRLKCDI